MKRFLFFLIFIGPFLARAQQTLKGTVTDETGHPLDVVTVTLSRNGNNIASALADSGRFTINYIAAGEYVITASLVGYQSFSRTMTLPKDTIAMIMHTDSRQLKEVVVSSSKPVIERHIDRITFNVENSVVASGGTAWEAVSKSPGVQIKSDNTINANKKGVQVYLDGKPLHISGDELASYLQGMPANLISKIEVFANPPASFDAEGGAVINILTKKNKAQGLNVNLNTAFTQATYSSYTGSANFNYRDKKLNIFGNYGYTSKTFGREQHDYVTYATPGNYSFWDSPGYNVIKSRSNSYKMGADYQLSENQVLGLLVTGYDRNGSTATNTPTTVTSNGRTQPDSTLLTSGNTQSKAYRYDFNLNYSIKLDTAGNSLNFDLDYSPYRSKPQQYVDNTTFLPDGRPSSNDFHIYTASLQHINIYTGKIDYNYKIGKRWTLTSGLKYSSINTKNNFDFYDASESSKIYLPGNSDHFDYTENTGAVYTSISGSFGKLSVQGGLRAEYTRTRGYSETLDSLNKRSYLKIFPTVYATYAINEKNELQLTYSYRIDRPGYALLNPSKHYATPYNYIVGNPGLQPAFIQDLELGYTYNKDFNLTAYYTSTHDLFTNITVQDNIKNLFYDTFENVGLSLNSGLRFSGAFHPAAWWDMSAVIEGYYMKEKSDYLQGSYDYHKLSYDANATATFTLDKNSGLKAEITGYYYGPGIQAIFRNSHISDIDAGVKINVLNGQGTIKLAANDIFTVTNTGLQ
jgi:outer membrane receptor protein involved in Fe transport